MGNYINKCLQILNSAIHDTVLDEDVLNTLPVQDLSEVLRLSHIHHLSPLVYDRIGKTKAFLNLPEEEREIFKKRALRMVTEQTMRTIHFLQILKEMQEAGIDPAVVKGIILRKLYPSPDLRPSADEDLLISEEQFWDMDHFLKEHGYQTAYKGKEIPFEAGYKNLRTGVYLEVHATLFEDSNEYNGLFNDVSKHTKHEVIDGVQIQTLTEEYHLLYLIAHAAKHFKYSGVGIRQVCDLAVFTEHAYQDIDFKDLYLKLQSADLLEFAESLYDIAEMYLGFSGKSCGMPERKINNHEDLLNDIMEGGAYGTASSDRRYSAHITLSENISKGIFRSLFPSRNYMERKYTELREHPYKLPLFYVKRMKEYVYGNKDLLAPLKKGKERALLIRKYAKKEYSMDTGAYMENVRESLRNRQEVMIPVVGNSMVPFLVNERDQVVIHPLSRPLKKGDIVLYQRDNGRYIMHRIVSVQKNTYTIAGDNENVYEKGIRKDQILGYAVRICRKGKWIDQNDRTWKFFSQVWVNHVPAHRDIIRLYSRLRKINNS